MDIRYNGGITIKWNLIVRVLDANGPILEKSYVGNATIMGNISATYFGTLTTHPRSEGFTYSEGNEQMQIHGE